MVKAYACHGAKKPIEDWEYNPAPLGAEQVEVSIKACGVCHSDLHQVNNDWGAAKHPLVVGHEIIGTVTALGSNVTSLELGQRVGIGPQTGSCMQESCRECCGKHQEQLCGKKDKSYNTPTGDVGQPMTYGGFADSIRCHAKWAFAIPEGLDTVDAAPLLCAGITTWSPFCQHKIGKGHRVGIVGIGGLGHIAIQFGNKRGCHVTALSRSIDKEEECKSLGAHAFLVTKDAAQMNAAAGTFDFLLSTVSADIDWTPYLTLLRPDGVLCMVGLPSKVSFNPMKLVANRLSVTGSYLASHSEIVEMLTFCADNNITAMTETMPMTAANCNEALSRVEQDLPRYRIVLTSD